MRGWLGTVPSRTRPDRGELSLTRVESFSDSVFAFAMTLLVLGLAVPRLSAVRDDSQLLRQLGREWPAFVAYVVSFLFVGQVWVQHHRLLGYLKRADHWVVWLNVLLLLDVVTISFVTGLLGTYTGHAGETAAALIYGVTWTIGGLFFNGLWWYGRLAGLIDPALTRADRRAVSLRWGSGPVLYAVCTVVALAQFWAGVAGFVLMLGFYLVPPPRALPDPGTGTGAGATSGSGTGAEAAAGPGTGAPAEGADP
jgi:uncharacterized membrane protein